MIINTLKKSNSTLLPSRQTSGSAGYDLFADNFKMLFDGDERDESVANIKDCLRLWPGNRVLVGTGISLEIPEGYEMQIRPRSGLALKHGITVLNTPGTIDSDYRNEIGIILINHSTIPYIIEIGERIAQAVFVKYEQVSFNEVSELSTTNRKNGFGSTGK